MPTLVTTTPPTPTGDPSTHPGGGGSGCVRNLRHPRQDGLEPDPDHPRYDLDPRQGRAHDAWRRGRLDQGAQGTGGQGVWVAGLGASGWRVDQALSPHQPRGVPELVALTGKSRGTVYRRLRQLLDAGLAVRVEGGYLARPADLDRVAERLGTRGLAARQRARHAAERAAHRAALARWLQERQQAVEEAARAPVVDVTTGELLFPADSLPGAPHSPPAARVRSA